MFFSTIGLSASKTLLVFSYKKRTFIFIKIYKYILLLKSVPILPENYNKNQAF